MDIFFYVVTAILTTALTLWGAIMPPHNKRANIAFCILGFMVIIPLYLSFSYAKRISAYLATPHQLPKVYSRPVILRIGTNLTLMNPGNVFSLSNLSPDTLQMTKEGEILIEMELHDKTGRIIAKVNNSQVTVEPSYDINSDKWAVEIIDPESKPILQIYKLELDAIVEIINQLEDKLKIWKAMQADGVIKSTEDIISVIKRPNQEVLQMYYFTYPYPRSGKTATVAICDSEGCSWGTVSNIEKRRETLKRIFAYPGYSHSGLRNRP